MYIKAKLKNTYADLAFYEESHTYVHQKKQLTPASNIVESFAEEFDTEKHATRVAFKRGISKEVVKKEWADGAKEAAGFGTITHNFGERYAQAKFFDNTDLSIIIPSNGHERAVIRYWNGLPAHIIPVYLELRMYSKEYSYAGTCDILLYNTITKKFILADYKTNKDLFKNFRGKRMYTPFGHFLDMPYNHYQIQLSLYQVLLEEQGFEVEDRHIVWLLPDGNYKLYKTKDLRKLLKKYLNDYRRSN